jgi:choline dehydrogenase
MGTFDYIVIGGGTAGCVLGPSAEGAAWSDLNVVDGKRQSAADGYLTPAVRARPNLAIVADARVLRLVVTQGTCQGAEYRSGETTTTAYADREVILCAGAVATPQLLMLSGIGPPAHLREHGFTVASDLPGVGRNLQDHPKSQVAFTARQQVRGGALVTPESRGTIRLASADPEQPPLIDPRYLTEPRDVTRMIAGLHRAREVGAANALAPLRRDEIFPGSQDTGGADYRDYLRRTISSYQHPVGTCRIGTDALSVVGPRLEVHGIGRLRVADASVMPVIPSGNTNAAVLAIAERAAALIADDVEACGAWK